MTVCFRRAWTPWLALITVSTMVCKHKKWKDQEKTLNSSSWPDTYSGFSTHQPMGTTNSLPPTSNTCWLSGFFLFFCQLMYSATQIASLCCALWNRWSWKMPYFFFFFFFLFFFFTCFVTSVLIYFTILTLKELRKLIVSQKL